MQAEQSKDKAERDLHGCSCLCKGLGWQEARRARGSQTTLSPGTTLQGGILAQESRGARKGFKIGGAEVSLIFPKGLCIWRMD